ncbi:M20 family metallopeptidase [Sinorhizobium meliloti]|uniref:M20 family metallopeptidase n=1 Tax=Rhizobium meliloti TaxID=382 RepID=UPI0001E4B9FE|nr:M20 family metallopeptidase [Sinorhizobium meliloti]AEG58082.1 Succinyl-diaminopimelate desuccinylase [Sinorhizobium meliloti AK83]MDE4589053.1 M20 family metallopeptidase [Sinorhizobium meliloti]SEJ84541.1 succinyl-diaminopimelate desuccinylase [Sinorhizobium meliloti]
METTIARPADSSLISFDPIQFLQQVVSIDSCDPPGGELEVAKLVHEQLLSLGIEAALDEFLPGRANVLGRIRGSGEKPAFVLSSHMDTVPVGTVSWKRPPFSGVIEGGRLYGRGATDMKSALASMIAAAGSLARKAHLLKGDVILAFTAGESANLLGARRFVEQGLKNEIGAFLCGEPSDLDVIIVEKAALWLRATATGRLGHVSGAAGINAIDVVREFLGSLKTMELNCPPHPLLDEPTIRVGRIEGGSAVNLTPDNCTVDFDIRLPPGVDHLSIVRQVENIVPENMTISILDFKPAVESLPDDEFVKLCTDVCARHRGKAPAIKGASYYSDGTVLLEGLSVPFAIIGPGELGLSGQADESVSTDNLLKAVEIYEDVALAWLS